MAKYIKREAKKGTFKWKAKEDIFMSDLFAPEYLIFSKGTIYSMDVVGTYTYDTTDDRKDTRRLTREFLRENFEEVN